MIKVKTKYWHATVFDVYGFLLSDRLSSSEATILFYLLKEMKRQRITIASTQKKIIDDLKLSKATVSKAISRLTDLQYCIKYEHSFMINPYLFYVGTQNERMQDIELFKSRLASINRAQRFDFEKNELGADDITVVIELESTIK